MFCGFAFELLRSIISGQINESEAFRLFRSDCCQLRKSCGSNWITVYLSDYSESVDGYDLVLDFYTLFDYLRYVEVFEERIEYLNIEKPLLSTFFFVAGYNGKDKPHRGHYLLNLSVLVEGWQKQIDHGLSEESPYSANSPFFIAEHVRNRGNQYSSLPLLIPLEPLVYPEWVFGDFYKEPVLSPHNNSDYQLIVNNVEQGNWNEILKDNGPYLMFDIGTNAFGKCIGQDIQRQLQFHPVNRDVEALFISHWHADHYNILTGMNFKELNHIKQLVCTPTIYNCTAFRIIQWFCLNPNTSLCLQRHPVGKKWQRFTLIPGVLNLYVRRNVKSNPNNAGLLLFFNGKENSVTLTGDAFYSTVQEVTNDAIGQFSCQKGYYLVAPHHGGETGKFTCNLDSRVNKLEALVSVGKVNPYGHPDSSIIYSLN